MVEASLSQLGIEDVDQQKYSTECPKCSTSRSKDHTKSLMVYRDPDGIRVECMHPGCVWYKNRQFIGARTNVVETKPVQKQQFQIPIPEGHQLPISAKGHTIYPYKNVQGETLFYMVRKDLENGNKTFFPLALSDTGEWLTKRPSIKCLYGAEDLANEGPVIVVEGEKARDAAKEIFTHGVVVTWAGGASSINMGDWDLLKGREVVLWPDNDAAGLTAMKRISTTVDANVSIVDVSSLGPKEDLADNLTIEQIQTIWETREDCNTPEVTGSYSSSQMFEAMKQTAVGSEIGFENMKQIRLPASGLVIIEGRSGHGKTTMMANMIVQKIKSGETPLVFYSYEMPARRILLKIVSIMDGRVLDELPYKNEEKYREEIRAGNNEVYNKLAKRLNKDLFITDAYLPIDKLLSNLGSPHMRGAYVFLDYIQYIPADQGSFNKSRYLVIKEFSDNIQNIAHKNKLVIMAGAQLTPGDKPRMDSPRESKDIHNVAELVLRVWNKNQGAAMGVQWKEVDELPGDLMIEVRKNRNGYSGGMYMFNFHNGCEFKEIKGDF